MMMVWFLLMAAASVVAFGLYGFDKRAAVRDDRRVPENTLHLVALLGGWPGAWLGQRVFRHKTSKPAFLAVFAMTVAVHVIASATLAWAFAR